MERELLLEKYLMNELNEAEWLQFKALVESDQDFKDEVEIRSVLYADYKTEIKKELLKNRPLELKEKEPTKIRQLFKPLISIAALVLLGIVGLLVFQLNNTTSLKNLTSQYLAEPLPNITVLMGDDNKNKLQAEAVLLAYQNKEYDFATQLFEKMENPANQLCFYAGLSYLYKKPRESQKAIVNFEKVIQSPNNFTEEALWYISLCYLDINQTEEAKKYLSQIKETSTNYQQAAKLLKKIE